MKKIMIALVEYSFALVVLVTLSGIVIPGFFVLVLGLHFGFFILAPAIILFSYFIIFYFASSLSASLKVLVVDNDLEFESTVLQKLNPNKFKVDILVSSNRAVEKLMSAEPYDLIMIRSMMPDLSEDEFLDTLDEAIRMQNLTISDWQVKAPPVLFFHRPISPMREVVHTHLAKILGHEVIATSDEFVKVLSEYSTRIPPLQNYSKNISI